MSQFPSMPLFIDAYLADTTHFSAEEHGAYLLLLMAMWRRGGWVPDNNRDLARMCCVNVRRWPRVKLRLMPLLTKKDGELSQKKLTATFEELRNRKAQKRSSDQHTKPSTNNGVTDARARPTPSPQSNKDLFNGSALPPSPGLGGRSEAAPEETLTADEIAAIKERLSWAH